MFRNELSIIQIGERQYRFSGFRELLTLREKSMVVDGLSYSRPDNSIDLYNYDELFEQGKMDEFICDVFGQEYTFYYYQASDFSAYNMCGIQSEFGNMAYCIFTHLGYDARWCSRPFDNSNLTDDIQMNSFYVPTSHSSASCSLIVVMNFQDIIKNNLYSRMADIYSSVWSRQKHIEIFDAINNDYDMVDRLIKFNHIRHELV